MTIQWRRYAIPVLLLAVLATLIVLQLAVPSSSSSSSSDNSTDLYGLRVGLCCLLIAAPCGRVVYLWYTGGGRVYCDWRRSSSDDENEEERQQQQQEQRQQCPLRIQYIPPMAGWLSIVGTNSTTSRTSNANDPGHSNNNNNNNRVLTAQDFDKLPEMVYHRDPTATPLTMTPTTIDHDVESNATIATTTTTTTRIISTSCTFCLEDFTDGETGLRRLRNCRHAFHSPCLRAWVLDRQQSTCPVCHASIL